MTDERALDPDALHLDHQLCFPLYAASRLITRLYQPLLEPLELTYPQYIVLMILWEHAPCSVSDIGHRVHLASNTLTPLLKRLEQLKLIQRRRGERDERVVTIALTDAGHAMRTRCAAIPQTLFERVGYPPAAAQALKTQLDALLIHLESLEKIDRE